jgi:predicted DNA-binding transcriptional regulator YafY
MARNDQAVRLLVVLKQLEASRQGLTLEQLAESLAPGSTRHPRTLRRDLVALEEAGYPLVTERINGQTCWRLMEGFRNVPGLRFSPSELMALTFSRRLITPLEGTELHTSSAVCLRQGRRRIAAAGRGLGPTTRRHL